jgi:hypothetical protein
MDVIIIMDAHLGSLKSDNFNSNFIEELGHGGARRFIESFN